MPTANRLLQHRTGPASDQTTQSRPTDATSRKSEHPTIRRELPNAITADWSGVDERIIAKIRETIRCRRWPLTLCGNVGSGKTCTAALICASWPGPDHLVKWFGAAEFIRLVQIARREGVVVLSTGEAVTESNLWRVRIDQPQLLVVDDLGTRTPTDSQYEIIFELIDRRHDKPLVVSTNHNPDALADLFDQRIASRLLAGTVIEFAMQDRRPQQGRHYRVGERLKVAEGTA